VSSSPEAITAKTQAILEAHRAPLAVSQSAAVSTCDETRAARLLHISLGIAALGVLLVAALLRVEEGASVVIPFVNRTLPELCYWRIMTGMECPGCGLTRCFIAAAHGDLAAAWSYNPIGVLLFAGVVFQIPYRAWQLWRISTGRDELGTIALPYVMLGVSVLLILQWFWRVLL
jgi:hypothetical protein